MIWGANGYMNGLSNALAMIPAIDFAGGTVVHMSSGWSALVLALILGPRIGFEKDRMMPHSLVLTFIGTALLWFGWYGFNSGSAFAADTISVSAFVSTTLATGVSCLVWGFIELMSKQKVSVLGMCSGVVSGLVVITPSAGFVSPSQSIIIGCLAGIIPYFFVTFLKHWLKYDDALDTFGIHGIGGTLGAILTGYYANPTINANLFGSAAVKNGMKDIIISNSLILVQLKAVMVTIILSIIGSMIIGFFIKFFIGLRHDNDEESDGLDIHDHGEEGYTMNG
jgi:Amt family ammonium transporter